jgi:hypothetical protein
MCHHPNSLGCKIPYDREWIVKKWRTVVVAVVEHLAVEEEEVAAEASFLTTQVLRRQLLNWATFFSHVKET